MVKLNVIRNRGSKTVPDMITARITMPCKTVREAHGIMNSIFDSDSKILLAWLEEDNSNSFIGVGPRWSSSTKLCLG